MTNLSVSFGGTSWDKLFYYNSRDSFLLSKHNANTSLLWESQNINLKYLYVAVQNVQISISDLLNYALSNRLLGIIPEYESTGDPTDLDI